MLFDKVIVFDNLKDTLFLIHHADVNQENAYQQAQQKLDQLEQLLAIPVSLQAKPHSAGDCRAFSSYLRQAFYA